MKIAIRVDASRAIGTGHVRRCLALAKAARALGAEVRFVTRDLGLDSAAPIAVAGFSSDPLPPPSDKQFASNVPHAAWAGVPAATDVRQTAEVLDGWAPDWLVIDHYGFDAEWHRGARDALGCRIVVIDDLADRPLAADIVVDHNFHPDHRAKYAGRLAGHSALLGGPRFALIGAEFGDAPRHEVGETVESIGVFLGGVDDANVSARVLAAIGVLGFDGDVEVVTTSANRHLAELQALCAKHPRIRLLTDLPNLAGFFARHDVQVGAGGGATWERCCLGAPTLLLVVAKNQLAVVPALRQAGIAVTTEPLGSLDPDAIASALLELIGDAGLRRELSRRSRELVDGLGAHRVALSLLADEIAVRPARPDDARRMHDWRNHPATRAASRQSGEIAWEDHRAWLESALDDSARQILVGQIGDVPVGVVRFDRLADDRAEVSLYLNPALHGLGLGLAMLRAAEAAEAHGLDIVAEVMDSNASSARLFTSAGYTRVDATHWIKPAAGPTRAKQER